MSIQLVSISHKIAPLAIRELFAFTKEQQEHLMKALVQEGGALESVVISTCNRTELYIYTEGTKKSFLRMEELLLAEAGAREAEHIADYLRFYQDEKAVRHLFLVAAGLDSLVMGEDQILGQVKQAQEQAMRAGTAGKYLNALFRYAITGAKRVKTDTELSKTSVSTATLAIKAGEERLGNLEGRRVMVIGGTGEIGGIVLKNLYSMKGIHVYSTVRNVTLTHDTHAKLESSTVIDYRDRYSYLNDMDLVISATSSPHYTLTYDKAVKCLTEQKTRVFVDLAVPLDIDQRIGEIPDTWIYNMDDFTELARANNALKNKAARKADGILAEYEQDFCRWLVFQQSAPIMAEVREWMRQEMEKKGFEKAVDKFFYRLREQASPEFLEEFFANIRDMER